MTTTPTPELDQVQPPPPAPTPAPFDHGQRIRINRHGTRNNDRVGVIVQRAGAGSPLWVIRLDGDRHTLCFHQNQIQPVADEVTATTDTTREASA